jgi:hypothetical protein
MDEQPLPLLWILKCWNRDKGVSDCDKTSYKKSSGRFIEPTWQIARCVSGKLATRRIVATRQSTAWKAILQRRLIVTHDYTQRL